MKTNELYDKLKKRGLGKKDLDLFTELTNEFVGIEPMARDLTEEELTKIKKDAIADAVKTKMVVFIADVDLMIQDAKEDFRKEIFAEQATKSSQSSEKNVKDFIKNTGLSDLDFARRLLRMNIGRQYLYCLRDDLHKLDDKALWAYIRANHNPKSSKNNVQLNMM